MAGTAPPGKVRVEVLSQDTAQALGVRGVVLRVARADGEPGSAPVSLEVDYSGFADAYGGNFGQRLTLVSLPACALVTPEVPACQRQTPVPTAENVETASVVSVPSLPIDDQDTQVATAASTAGRAAPASVSGQVFAVSSTASSSAGTFSATSLSPTYEWAAGSQGGEFSFTYPMTVPPGLGGPVPSVALGYSSSSVDGITSNSNQQASWVGRGWDYDPGYVERSYRSCSELGYNTGDQCWAGDTIATMVLNGRSMNLVKGKDTGVWRVQDGDGWRVNENFYTPNGDIGGTFWQLTAPDGTVYYFGKESRYSGDYGDTNSTLVVPVYNPTPGDPCYGGSYANSMCMMAYRWKLDYVVDPRGNSMTYQYAKITGSYNRNNGTQGITQYDLSSSLVRIDYGQRAGAEAVTPWAARVDFLHTDRVACYNGTCWYPDTPFDQYCAPNATVCSVYSPVFFNSWKLEQVTTSVLGADGASWLPVDQYQLGYEYWDAGGQSGNTLWLRSITHTGHVGVIWPSRRCGSTGSGSTTGSTPGTTRR